MEKKPLYYIFFISFLIYATLLSAQSKGETLFYSNNPLDASVAIEEELKEGRESANTYNYLGLAYFQLNENDKALDAFNRGLKSSISSKKELCFNAGNVLYKMGNYTDAENYYNLALSVDKKFYSALLNRANARLMQEKYKEASVDYKKYLEEFPEDPQFENINRIILSIDDMLLAKEKEKSEKEREEQARKDEKYTQDTVDKLVRQELERKEKEEKQRQDEKRRKLLEDVAASLQQTESTKMTAGTEGAINYDNESILD